MGEGGAPVVNTDPVAAPAPAPAPAPSPDATATVAANAQATAPAGDAKPGDTPPADTTKKPEATPDGPSWFERNKGGLETAAKSLQELSKLNAGGGGGSGDKKPVDSKSRLMSAVTSIK